jgi:hypothetical protein
VLPALSVRKRNSASRVVISHARNAVSAPNPGETLQVAIRSATRPSTRVRAGTQDRAAR